MVKDTQAVGDRARVGPRRRRQPISPRQWWRETRSELRKVTWPTGDQTRNLTVVVIAVCVVMALFLFAVDSLLSLIVKAIIGIQ